MTEIRAAVTGLLQRQAFADEGNVREGDLLYVIDPQPFETQRARALASFAQAEARLAEARQDYDHALAHVRSAELSLEATAIRASREGFMGSSQVKPGALVTAQQTLMGTLYSSEPMA